MNPGETYHHVVVYKFGLREEGEAVSEEQKPAESTLEWPGEGQEQEKSKSVSGKSDDLLSAKLEENGR